MSASGVSLLTGRVDRWLGTAREIFGRRYPFDLNYPAPRG